MAFSVNCLDFSCDVLHKDIICLFCEAWLMYTGDCKVEEGSSFTFVCKRHERRLKFRRFCDWLSHGFFQQGPCEFLTGDKLAWKKRTFIGFRNHLVCIFGEQKYLVCLKNRQGRVQKTQPETLKWISCYPSSSRTDQASQASPSQVKHVGPSQADRGPCV